MEREVINGEQSNGGVGEAMPRLNFGMRVCQCEMLF
jgi:hypothetical protein